MWMLLWLIACGGDEHWWAGRDCDDLGRFDACGDGSKEAVVQWEQCCIYTKDNPHDPECAIVLSGGTDQTLVCETEQCVDTLEWAMSWCMTTYLGYQE
jgi:hypothetical protein